MKAETVAATHKVDIAPWLLDRAQLQKLAEVLEEHWAILEERRGALVDQMVSRKVRAAERAAGNEKLSREARAEVRRSAKEAILGTYSMRVQRTVVMAHRDGHKTQGASLLDVLRQPELEQKHVESLKVEWRHAEIYLNLSIRGWAMQGASLEISTGPDDAVESRHLFTSLSDFFSTSDIAPSRGLRAWAAYGHLMSVCLLAGFALLMLVVLAAGGAHQSNREAARVLLQDGVSANEVPQAVELILRERYPTAAPGAQRLFPTWMVWASVFVCVSLVVLLVHPRGPEFGVGHGKNRIKMWRRWVKFVTYTVPLAVGGHLAKLAWEFLQCYLGG